MFIVFSGVYALCAMGNLSAGDPPPKVEVIHQETPKLTVAPDGTRTLQLDAKSSFKAKHSPSLGVWEVSGTMAEGHVAGVLKVEDKENYAFSGTVFLKSGQLLTTQTLNILPGDQIKATDLVTEESYSFTREEAFKGTNPSMPQGRIAALCAVLSVLSVTEQP